MVQYMRSRFRRNLLLAGSCLAAAFWMADAVLDGVLFGEGGFLHQFVHPDWREVAYRAQALVFLLFFLIFAWRKARARELLDDTLNEALADLEAERARSASILDAMPDAVSVQDTRLRILYQNQAHREMMGDHVGDFCYAAYQQRDEACPGCHLLEAFTDGLPHRRESSFVGDKGVRYVEISSSPLQDSSGTIIAGIESVRDITDHKQAEIRLQQQLAAIEASMDGIAILTGGEEFVYLNRAYAHTYGYDSVSELIGMSCRILYDEEEHLRLKALVQERGGREGGWRGEAYGKRKDGSTFPLEMSVTTLEDGGIVCVVRDITERVRADAEIHKLNESLQQQTLDLQSTNRELEAFGYSLSHDLRSPLTRVYVAAQTLAETHEELSGDTFNGLLRIVLSGCEHMEELIEAMLDLFRVTRSEVAWAEVDLSSLAGEIMVELRLQDPERRVECVITPGLSAQCDPHLVRILLENLLGNAWKYTGQTDLARIEFGRSECADGEVFYVRDNGVGFDMADADRIFKPFQRLHRSSDFPGTGVGLATVQRIVDRHGGTVRGEGAVGQGATFFFTLRRPEPADTPPR